MKNVGPNITYTCDECIHLSDAVYMPAYGDYFSTCKTSKLHDSKIPLSKITPYWCPLLKNAKKNYLRKLKIEELWKMMGDELWVQK